MRPIDVLLNDKAGTASGDSRQRIEAAFAQASADARVVATAGDRLTAAAERGAADGRILVAAGGDGTVSTVAAVAAAAGATFGVIPLGTLNHFARDAGIPLELEAAVGAIAGGAETPIDIAEANGRIFVNNASAGFYARIVRERQLEQRRGYAKWTAFALGLARAWRDYRPITVRLTLDGASRIVRTPFVFVGNGAYVTEGLQVGRRTSIATGTLSLYTAPDCTRGQMLSMVAHALAGRLAPDVALESTTARELTIDPRRPHTPLAMDGELVQMQAPIHFSVRPAGLRLLRPRATAG